MKICNCYGYIAHRHCPYCDDLGLYKDDPHDYDTDGVECEWCFSNKDSYFRLVEGYPHTKPKEE